MDGETVLSVAVIGTINIVSIITTLYYLKGKVENMDRSINKRIDDINKRIDDLKDYFAERLNDFYKMFNTRIKNIEEIVFREE